MNTVLNYVHEYVCGEYVDVDGTWKPYGTRGGVGWQAVWRCCVGGGKSSDLTERRTKPRNGNGTHANAEKTRRERCRAWCEMSELRSPIGCMTDISLYLRSDVHAGKKIYVHLAIKPNTGAIALT